MMTWEEREAEAERRREAEKVLYAIKQYFDEQSSFEKASNEFDGPSPGYFLSGQQESVERRAVEALDALEALIDSRVKLALENKT